jgi:hypothetical protein
MFIASETGSIVSPVGAKGFDITLLQSVEESELFSYRHSAPPEQWSKSRTKN